MIGKYLSFLLVFAIILTAQAAPIEHNDNSYVDRALEIKEQTDRGNSYDIKTLWDLIDDPVRELSDDELKNLIVKIDRKLESERELLKKVQKILKDESAGSIPLTSSLRKLLGTDTYSGILEDVQAMLNVELKKNILRTGVESLKPQHNKITVLKSLLIYTAIMLEEQGEIEVDLLDLKIVYPTQLPQCLIGSGVIDSTLFCDTGGERRLMIPNAGYIYGGDLIDGKNSGVDCSAYVGRCTNFSGRLTTMLIEYAWRFQKNGLEGFNEKERKTYDWLMEQGDLQRTIDEYEALDVSVEYDYMPGDLLTWRSRGGHVVMVIKKISDGVYEAVEAARKDDKKVEGVLIRTHKLFKAGYKTYVVRKREL